MSELRVEVLMLFSNYLPDAWVTSWHTLIDMRNASKTASNARMKLIISAIPGLAGFLSSFAVLDRILPATFFAAVIAVTGILAGFLMNLMLATGRPPSVSVNIHNAKLVRARIQHMLADNTITLSLFFLALFFGIIVLMFDQAVFSTPARAMQSGCIALLSAGLFRALFQLPYQLYELHDYHLMLFIEGAEQKNQERLAKLKDDPVE